MDDPEDWIARIEDDLLALWRATATLVDAASSSGAGSSLDRVRRERFQNPGLGEPGNPTPEPMTILPTG